MLGEGDPLVGLGKVLRRLPDSEYNTGRALARAPCDECSVTKPASLW